MRDGLREAVTENPPRSSHRQFSVQSEVSFSIIFTLYTIGINTAAQGIDLSGLEVKICSHTSQINCFLGLPHV